MQSVHEGKFDYLSAIYHLLSERFKKHKSPKISTSGLPPELPLVTRTERRSSITTGVGACETHCHAVRDFTRSFNFFAVEHVEVPVEMHNTKEKSASASSSPRRLSPTLLPGYFKDSSLKPGEVFA